MRPEKSRPLSGREKTEILTPPLAISAQSLTGAIPSLPANAELDQVRSRAYLESVLASELASLENAQQGARNQEAFRVACRLIELANSPDFVFSQASAVGLFYSACEKADRNGKDPFTRREHEQVWRSAVAKVSGGQQAMPADTLHGRTLDVPNAHIHTETLPTRSPGTAPSATAPLAPILRPATVVADTTPVRFEPASQPSAISPASGVVRDEGEAAGSPGSGIRGRLVLPSDLAKRRISPALVSRLIPAGGAVWLLGAPKTFKSVIGLALAASIGKGTPFLDRRVRQGAVLYVLAEGVGGFGLRVRAHEQRYGPIEGVYILPESVQFDDTDTWKQLAQVAWEIGVSAIIIDTQARVTVGLEENKSWEAGRYIAFVDWLRGASDATVITVHHTGVGTGRARGSGAFDGAADTFLLAERVIGEPLRATLTPTLQKDMPGQGDPIDIQFEERVVGVDPETNELVSSVTMVGVAEPRDEYCDITPSLVCQNSIAFAIRAITNNGDGSATRGEINRVLKEMGNDFPYGQVMSSLATMVSLGFVTLEGSKYSINPD